MLRKRLLAGFLSAALVIGLVPATTFADVNTEADQTNGSNLEAEDSPTDSSVNETEEDKAAVNDSENAGESEENPAGTETPEETETTEETVTEDPKDALLLPPPGTITGFEELGQDVSTICIGYKMDYAELMEQMPDTIKVYLDNASESVEIPVTWQSEMDYTSTDETYYFFWATWDVKDYPLVAGYNMEDYIPFVEVIIDYPMMLALSAGQQNIVDRALEQVNVRWTPLTTVNGFYSNTDPLTIFYAGVTYNGIPYGQQVSSGTWVPNSTSIDTFLNAVNTPGSLFYTARGRYGDMNSTYYANDCSSFVSYAYGLPRMTTSGFARSSLFTRVDGNNIYNAEVGDCFNRAASHIELITAMNYDANGNLVSVEVSEQTPPKARTVIYTPSEVQSLINTGYTLLRYIRRDSVAGPVGYNGYENDRQNPIKIIYGAASYPETYPDVPVNADSVTLENLDLIKGTGRIVVKNVTSEGGVQKVEIPTWSTEDHSDIYWYQAKKLNDTTWYADFNIANHDNNRGTYTFHAYGTNYSDSRNFMVSTTAEVEEVDLNVYADAVTIENLNLTNGTCRILVSGVRSDAGISKIEIPCWSVTGQPDIYWYQAKKLDATTWYADFDIANHDNNRGTYNIHVYGTNNEGIRNFMIKTTQDIKEPSSDILDGDESDDVEIQAEVSGTQVTFTCTNVTLPDGVKSVVLPVWSVEKGQDDLTWNKCSYNASTKVATVTIDVKNYKHYGDFNCHLYATDLNGVQTFLAKTVVTVQDPDAIIPLNITGQPEDQTVLQGKKATFAVIAEGTGLTYQWQYSPNNGKSWTSSTASSAKSPILLTTVQSTYTGRLYRCKVTDVTGKTVHTVAAKLTVIAIPKITSQPADVKIGAGKKATFHIEATGTNLTYKWQYSTNGGKSWISSTASTAKTDTLVTTVQKSYSGRLYRCVVTDSYGQATKSETALLTVG